MSTSPAPPEWINGVSVDKAHESLSVQASSVVVRAELPLQDTLNILDASGVPQDSVKTFKPAENVTNAPSTGQQENAPNAIALLTGKLSPTGGAASMSIQSSSSNVQSTSADQTEPVVPQEVTHNDVDHAEPVPTPTQQSTAEVIPPTVKSAGPSQDVLTAARAHAATAALQMMPDEPVSGTSNDVLATVDVQRLAAANDTGILTAVTDSKSESALSTSQPAGLNSASIAEPAGPTLSNLNQPQPIDAISTESAHVDLQEPTIQTDTSLLNKPDAEDAESTSSEVTNCSASTVAYTHVGTPADKLAMTGAVYPSVSAAALKDTGAFQMDRSVSMLSATAGADQSFVTKADQSPETIPQMEVQPDSASVSPVLHDSSEADGIAAPDPVIAVGGGSAGQIIPHMPEMQLMQQTMKQQHVTLNAQRVKLDDILQLTEQILGRIGNVEVERATASASTAMHQELFDEESAPRAAQVAAPEQPLRSASNDMAAGVATGAAVGANNTEVQAEILRQLELIQQRLVQLEHPATSLDAQVTLLLHRLSMPVIVRVVIDAVRLCVTSAISKNLSAQTLVHRSPRVVASTQAVMMKVGSVPLSTAVGLHAT